MSFDKIENLRERRSAEQGRARRAQERGDTEGSRMHSKSAAMMTLIILSLLAAGGTAAAAVLLKENGGGFW